MQAELVTDVLKNTSSIEITPIGAYENFEITGGDAYIEWDKFTYTRYTLGTESFTLDNCEGIDFSHNKGELVSPTFGVRFRDIAPISLKEERNDPDGLADAIMTIIDSGMFKKLKDEVLDSTKNIDPNRAELEFLKYIVSNNGLESNENMSESMQRSLARQASNVLSLRGTENAFKFMVWHTLGYTVDVEIDRAKINMRYNDRNFRMYTPPTEMEISDKTVGYWKFTEGIGNSVNSILGGNDFIIPNSAMWDSDCMFVKDASIEITNTYPYIESLGSSISLGNLHGKNAWRLRLMMKPAVGWASNQILLYKGSMIRITMPSATDLKVTISDGVTTIDHTFSDCINVDEWNYISIIFSRPTLALVVNTDVIESVIAFDIDMVDDGSSWIIGDKTGGAEYRGKIDTFMIDVGETYLVESIKYFEHIEILRSYNTDLDRNCYSLDIGENDGHISVLVTNGDGDEGKAEFLQYLIEEWLTISNYTITTSAHLPLELEFLF